jgi:hypothetical protein
MTASLTAIYLAAAMTNLLEQAVALLGAFFVLLAYALQRFKRISADSFAYLLLNFTGGALLCWAAVNTGQLGFILLEGAWALISLFGLWHWWRSKVSLSR